MLKRKNIAFVEDVSTYKSKKDQKKIIEKMSYKIRLVELREENEHLRKIIKNNDERTYKNLDKVDGFNIRACKQKVKGKIYQRWIASRSITIEGKSHQMNVYLGKEKPPKHQIAKKIYKYLSARPKFYKAVYGAQQCEFDF